MTRADFSQKMDPVVITDITNNLKQYQLFLNEIKGARETEDGDTEIVFSYDFHEFRETVDVLDQADVLADPEAYLDYVPHNPEDDPEVVKDDRLTDLEDTIAALMEMLLGGE